MRWLATPAGPADGAGAAPKYLVPPGRRRPLMRESSCDREINAIDSEFRRNLQSDVRRLFQLGDQSEEDES